jgi:pimeloyl-ACP methyl ester carboxylesterase
MPSFHSIRPALVTLAAVSAGATGAALQAPAPVSSSYTIFMRSVPIGSEQVSVTRSTDGWTVDSSSRMGAPIDLVARSVSVRYTSDWKPLELTIDATLAGQPLTDHTVVSGGTARSDGAQAGQPFQKTDTIAADAIFLPSPFWGPFEALAAKVRTAPAGATIEAYLLQSSMHIQVGESSDEGIQTTARLIHARRTLVKLEAAGSAPLDAEVWGDENGHLLRLTIPAQSLDVLREDIASVAARRVVVSHAGDEQIHVTANGFSIAATVSKPTSGTGKPLPAVVLVSGSEPTDRDETVAGVPIFGQLANALADAGFLVVRYDKRGAGQSGGRTEAAAIEDFSDDLRAVVKATTDRKDVDRKRLAVIGYGEGGPVAMFAASKEGRVSALVLVSAMGTTGADLNLYQVTHALDRAKASEANRRATIDLQKSIQQAVLTGSGWDTIPPATRRQAETPWFQSFLAFDPAKTMSNIDQPVMIVQGDLDTQVPPPSADALEAAANARKKARAAEVAHVAGINHLLVPAVTGELDEYQGLKDKNISPAIPKAIAAWLQKTLPAGK